LDGDAPLRIAVEKFRKYVSSCVHLYRVLSIGGYIVAVSTFIMKASSSEQECIVVLAAG
jgi:hypothetical protein